MYKYGEWYPGRNSCVEHIEWDPEVACDGQRHLQRFDDVKRQPEGGWRELGGAKSLCRGQVGG